MGILNFGKKVGGATARALGRAPTTIMSSRAAMGAVGVGALALGAGSKVGPATKDAALGAAFGDENADQYFTGRDLNARTLVGSMMGGVGGGMLQASAPGDFMATHAGFPGGGTGMLAASAATGVMGGAAGGVTGSVLGGAIGGALSMGRAGKIAGGLMGGIAGAAMGGALPSAGVIGGHITNNQEFFRQSPYSTSSSTASQLSASGDIVLGMHNSRRGY